MTLDEMLTALEDVATEFPKFMVDGKRAALWYQKFQKMPAEAFRKVVARVLEKSRYEPKLVDFEEARNALGSRNRAYDNERCTPDKVASYELWLATTKDLRKEQVGELGYRWGKKRRMDIILQAFGHRWVNDQLCIDSAAGLMTFLKQFGVGEKKDGESIAHQNRYKDWTEKMFPKAWEKLYGDPPTDEICKQYD